MLDRANNLPKWAKNLSYLLNFLSDLSTEVHIWYWKLSKFNLGLFFRKIKLVTGKIWLLLTTGAVDKETKNTKESFGENHGHNILNDINSDIQNLKIASLSWNFLPRVLRICRIFLFLTGNTAFRQICSKNTKLLV